MEQSIDVLPWIRLFSLSQYSLDASNHCVGLRHHGLSPNQFSMSTVVSMFTSHLDIHGDDIFIGAVSDIMKR
jgi:predicted alternative tryptophan synthase beta-subunit